MSITPVTTEDLRRMWNQEGLVIQGCGGDLNEWVDGINELLEQTGILRNGSKFESVMTFQNGETTCLLFPFDGVDADIGKLALWRLDTVAESSERSICAFLFIDGTSVPSFSPGCRSPPLISICLT